MSKAKDEYHTFVNNELDNEYSVVCIYVKELEKQNKELLDCLIKSTEALKEKLFIQKMDEVCESFIGFGLMPKNSQPEEGSISDIIEKQIEVNEALISKLAAL